MTPPGARVLDMLHVHRAERADRLADGLAETLLDPLDDPFAADVVAVPTRGVERGLTQRLSTRLGTTAGLADGVCANVEFPFPGRLILGSLAAATGIEPDHDPWLAERSVWPLLEVVDECLDEPWLATLALHLSGARGDPDDPPRRFGVVRHIADLFDRYGVHRPDMLRAWAAGSGESDEDGWQAELWRRLRERMGQLSPAERLPRARARIPGPPRPLGPPPPALAVRPHADAPLLPRRSSRHRVHARGASVCPAPVADALETGSKRDRGRHRHGSPRGSNLDASGQPPARLLGPRRARAPARDRRRRRRRSPPRAARARAPHAARRHSGRRARRPPATGRAAARGAGPAPGVGVRGPESSGPRLPRPRPPGRGPARRRPAPARGGPHARATRRDRHVPGHRDVRPAHSGDVRLRKPGGRGRRRG